MDVIQRAREFKVLGDPNRLRILQVLLKRDRTVQGLIPYLGIKPSSISLHLNHLRGVGLVREYRKGRSKWYSYDETKFPILTDILNELPCDIEGVQDTPPWGS